MNDLYQSPVPQTPSTVVPPGWYADPSGQPLQRYWDGFAWSAVHVRPYPAQQIQSTIQSAAGSGHIVERANNSGVEYRQLGMPAGVPWMIAGAILTIWRIFYTAGNLDSMSQGGAYNDGVLAGTAFGFLIGGILIGHGYYQYREWESDPTAKPARRFGWQVLPVALPVAFAGFLAAWMMAAF